jgi:hypothetical protein
MTCKDSGPTESRNLQIKSFNSDLVRSNNPHQPAQFLFVDGPSLGRRDNDSRSRNTRSAFIRRRISEKKNTYRQEEETKRQELIVKHQAWRECVCWGTVKGQAQNQGIRDRPIVSQTPNGGGSGVGMCSSCGGSIPVSHQAHGSSSLALSMSPSTGRADPFAAVDPSLRPGVDGLLQFGQ